MRTRVTNNTCCPFLFDINRLIPTLFLIYFYIFPIHNGFTTSLDKKSRSYGINRLFLQTYDRCSIAAALTGYLVRYIFFRILLQRQTARMHSDSHIYAHVPKMPRFILITGHFLLVRWITNNKAIFK